MAFKKRWQLSYLSIALLSGASLFTPAMYVTAQAGVAAKIETSHVASKKQLDQLADAFYESRAKFDPLLFASINGDNRYDSQLAISIAPQNRAKQFALMHKMQAQLKKIARTQLNEKDQLNYDLLAYELDSALHLEHFPEHLLPINQMDNVPSTLANFAGGDGSQALKTVPQYYAYLARLNVLPAWIEQAIKNMREGIQRGIVQPKAITLAMLPQFKALPNANAEASIFYTPIKNLPAHFSAADKQKLTKAYNQTIRTKLTPALQRLVHFLEPCRMAQHGTKCELKTIPPPI